MDLWIRSQDKRTLINTRRIDVDDKSIIVWDEGRYASEIYLGEYKTEERALEILDEIQNILVPKIKYTKGKINGSFNGVVIRNEDTMEIKEFSTFVYEMPKE